MPIKPFAALFSVLLASSSTLAQAPAAPAAGLTCHMPAPANTPADKALAAGDAAAAAALFEAQLAAAPTAANYAGLVHADLAENNVPEAIAVGGRAVTALPASADAMAALGDAFARAGQIAEASTAFGKAIALDRCSAAAHFGAARLNAMASRHLSATRELSFAHRLAPNDPTITAAYLEDLPATSRGPALRALLAGHPALPPAQIARLTDDLAVVTQRLTCSAEQAPAAQRLQLEKIYQNGRYVRSWGLKAQVNDAALPVFEVDTLADGIILNASDAAKAHVRPLAGTAADAATIYKGVADEIRIGDATYRGCPVTVVPNDVLDNRNSLIGTNFFRDYVVHLDYVAMTLALTSLPPLPLGSGPVADSFVAPDEKDWTPIYLAGGNVLVPTLINKKGPYLFALDTGIGHSIISPAVTKKELSTTGDNTLNLEGYDGTIVKVIPKEGGVNTDVSMVRNPQGTFIPTNRPVKLPVLRFAGIEVPDDSVVSIDLTLLSHAADIDIGGLLGFHVLSYFSVDINYRDGLAKLQFDQNRRYHERQNTLGY